MITISKTHIGRLARSIAAVKVSLAMFRLSLKAILLANICLDPTNAAKKNLNQAACVSYIDDDATTPA